MSTIDLLELSNVRAFGLAPQRIKFYHPLTLIVGQNGSGKTTIVEALKYATSGSLPPGTGSGGSFVHDPNLGDGRPVKALIKLSFHTAKGALATCSRRMEASRARGTLTFKSIENAWKVDDDGEQIKEAVLKTECNEKIPQLLGVSPAALNLIVFCHQDDSYWPLSAASEVKKNFDILFKSKEYAVAVEKLAISRKQYTEQGKLLDQQVKHEAVNKDKAQSVLRRTETLTDEIADIDIHLAEVASKTEQANVEQAEASRRMQQASTLFGDLNAKRQQAEAHRRSISNLKKSLQELRESDRDLADRLANYEEHVRADDAKLSQCKQEANENAASLTNLRNAIADKQGEFHAAQERHAQHHRQIEERQTLMKQTANMHDIRGYAVEPTIDQIEEFLPKLLKKARESDQALQHARVDSREKLQKADAAIADARQRESTINADRNNARKLITANDDSMVKLQRQLDSVNVDESDKAASQRQLDAATHQLKALQDSAMSANWQSQVSDSERELGEVERDKRKLEDEHVVASRAAGDVAQVDTHQKDIADRKNRITTLSITHKDSLDAIVGPGWQASNIASLYKAASERANADFDEAKETYDDSARKITTAQQSLDKCRKDIEQRESAMSEAAAAINAVTSEGASKYLTELDLVERECDMLRSDTARFSMMINYLDQCLDDLTQRHVCRTCTRDVKRSDETAKAKANIQQQRAQYVRQDVEHELASAEEQLESLKGVAEEHQTWVRLGKTELPALKKEEQACIQQHAAAKTRADKHEETMRDMLAAKREVDEEAKAVSTLDKHHNEISELETKLSEVTARMASTGSTRGLDAITSEKQKLAQQEQALRAKLDQARTELQRLDKQISDLRLNILGLENSINQIASKLQQKISIASQIAELKSANVAQRQAMTTTDADLASVAEELANARQVRQDVGEQADERERILLSSAKKLSDSVQKVQQIYDAIQAYIDQDGEGKLGRAEAAIKRLKSQTAESEEQATEIRQRVEVLQNTLRNHNNVKRNIADNLQYREESRELETALANIADLESRNVETEFQKWQEKYNNGAEVLNQLNNKRTEHTAISGQKQLQLELLNQEYEQFYKGSAQKYKKAVVEAIATKSMVHDLGKLVIAVETGIMQYHKVKMDEINRIIDDLWRNTYRGTDVDTIYIRADVEKKGKSYNYRVCMMKQQCEMDMRGRCSAGQRVLACIIIRLALAEVFSSNCGVIALDEPTTNLDQDNITALAESLAELIKVRKAQKNFQLLVITHDEEFLKAMRPSDHEDYVQRVTRNINQESVIQRDSIHSLMR